MAQADSNVKAMSEEQSEKVLKGIADAFKGQLHAPILRTPADVADCQPIDR